MSWDDYRYFLALARKGSASATAQDLGVSHTTVSRRIAALEERLGCRLFDKLTTGYRLTVEGEEIVAHAEHMETAESSLNRKSFARNDQIEGEVCITVPESIFLPLLLSSARDLNQRYSKLELSIKTTDNILNIRNREADIAVRITSSPEDYLVGRNLAKTAYAVYRVTDDKAVNSWVLWYNEPRPPDTGHSIGTKWPIALRVTSILSKLAAVKAGLGVAELPCFIGDQEQGLERLTNPRIFPDWSIWIVTHEDLVHTRRIRVVLDALYLGILSQKKLIEGHK